MEKFRITGKILDGKKMGEEYLYQKWLDETVEDLQRLLVARGVEGILYAFEFWLEKNGHLKKGRRN